MSLVIKESVIGETLGKYSSSYGRRGVRSEITRYQRPSQRAVTLLR